MENTLITFALAIIVVVISFLVYLGLRGENKVSWLFIILSVVLLLLGCVWIIIANLNAFGMIAYKQIIYASGVAFISGVVLILTLYLKRKVAGLIVAVLIPFAFLGSLKISFPYTPNQVVRRNASTIIANALDAYYRDHQTYPETLSDLKPDYLDDLQEPSSIWGWLYSGNGTDYTIGYVTYVDKFGYSICKSSASSPEWTCPNDNSTDPFVLQPTPSR